MRRLPFAVFFAAALTLTAANLKLYQKDGSVQIVREYSVDGDRVRYYSVERSDWEEIPAALIDLKRTDAEADVRKKEIVRQDQETADEQAAAREVRDDIHKIPRDPGLYLLSENKELRIFEAADASLRSEKGLNALKSLSPLPVFSGKATLEIAGEQSHNMLKDRGPEFYLQLAAFESFAMVRLTPRKGSRIVERVSTQNATKEVTEQRELIQTFTKQLSDNGLYKVWPQDSLAPGEYAVVEYTEGKINIQVWDFRIE